MPNVCVYPFPAMAKLSPRQLELARLVAAGYTNNEIAQKLGLAHQTVKNHIRSVFFKLSAHNRVQVALKLSQSTLPHQNTTEAETVEPKQPLAS